MIIQDTKVIAKTVLLRPDRTVLILKRSSMDEKGPGELDLPGGTVEPGEAFTDAAVRETLEEVGINIEPHKLKLIYTKSGNYQRANRCWLIFIGEVNQDQKVVLSHEHEAFEWASINEVSDNPMFQQQELALAYIVDNLLAA